jgi:hypothetical protein
VTRWRALDDSSLGPSVGWDATAEFTTHRARLDVVAREAQPAIGSIDFAVAYDTPSGSTENIEGHAVMKLDVPIARTFENHERYDALLVDGAIDALRSGAK